MNHRQFFRVGLFLVACPLILAAYNFPAQAEIIPDNSLNTETSLINSLGVRDIINGGAIRGVNLFHSFQEFNIEANREAYFANPAGINNIISRITGQNASQIFGTLGVLGNANLFLINPQGIIFGSNSRLDVRGSFLATTADGMVFDNNLIFSASNPQSPPLLTINVPSGLQMGTNPGRIINQSQATSSQPTPPILSFLPIPQNAGLQVPPGQSLGLIGGDIIMDGGGVSASSGKIFIGSIAEPEFVGLKQTPRGFNLDFDNVQKFGNIEIYNNSLINASGIGGSQINLIGEDISLDNSRIYAFNIGNIDDGNMQIQGRNFLAKSGTQISSFSLASGKSSDINIITTDSIEILGIGLAGYREAALEYTSSGTLNPFNPQFTLITASTGNGAAGNILLDTNNLRFSNGVLAGSGVFADGSAGNIDILTKDFQMEASLISNVKTRDSTGEVGSIRIATDNLTLENEAALTTLTLASGDSGDISIKAQEDVKLLNTPEGGVVATSITTTTFGFDGSAGNITIDARRLIIGNGGGINSSNGAMFGNRFFSSDGGIGGDLTIRATESVELFGMSGVLNNGGIIPSSIAAQTTTAKRGGNIDINTPNLSVRDGGIISASSFGEGKAGDIRIDAKKIEVLGRGYNETFSRIDSANFILGLGSMGAGSGGSLNLNTQDLIVKDGGTLTVQASGNASAGNINLVADRVNLDNQARIDATTGAGTGGNINFNTQDVFLRRGSRIRTDAGSADGGNINMDSRFIVAIPRENSDITANAVEGDGGGIYITTQGIFGLQVADELTPNSDITASSQFGVDGVVTVNTLNTEPQLIDELPSGLVNESQQIAQTCSQQARKNYFAIAGKGGIGYTPKEFINPHPSWIDWRVSAPSLNRSRGNDTNTTSIKFPSVSNPIMEANGWVRDNRGNIKLVAKSTQPTHNMYVSTC